MPLVVLLHGSGMSGRSMLNYDGQIFQKLADAHGFIMLSASAHDVNNGWDNLNDSLPRFPDVVTIDAALRYVLRHYAIDPTRIALLGTSAGASLALQLGIANGDVFSRVVLFSGFLPFSVDHEFDRITARGRPMLFVGLDQPTADGLHWPAFVERMRHQGYSVTYVPDSGEHYSRERIVAGLSWLAQSWQ